MDEIDEKTSKRLMEEMFVVLAKGPDAIGAFMETAEMQKMLKASPETREQLQALIDNPEQIPNFLKMIGTARELVNDFGSVFVEDGMPFTTTTTTNVGGKKKMVTVTNESPFLTRIEKDDANFAYFVETTDIDGVKVRKKKKKKKKQKQIGTNTGLTVSCSFSPFSSSSSFSSSARSSSFEASSSSLSPAEPKGVDISLEFGMRKGSYVCGLKNYQFLDSDVVGMVFLKDSFSEGIIRWSIKGNYKGNEASLGFIVTLSSNVETLVGRKKDADSDNTAILLSNGRSTLLMGVEDEGELSLPTHTHTPDGSIISVEVDLSAHTVTFFVNGRKIPHVVTNMPSDKLSIGVVGGESEFVSQSLRRLDTPTATVSPPDDTLHPVKAKSSPIPPAYVDVGGVDLPVEYGEIGEEVCKDFTPIGTKFYLLGELSTVFLKDTITERGVILHWTIRIKYSDDLGGLIRFIITDPSNLGYYLHPREDDSTPIDNDVNFLVHKNTAKKKLWVVVVGIEGDDLVEKESIDDLDVPDDSLLGVEVNMNSHELSFFVNNVKVGIMVSGLPSELRLGVHGNGSSFTSVALRSLSEPVPSSVECCVYHVICKRTEVITYSDEEHAGFRYEGGVRGEGDERVPHGEGVFTYGSNAVYEGSFTNGSKDGKGKYTELCAVGSDSSCYDGEWKDDMRHGLGIQDYADGCRYVGAFEKDCLHGEGKLLDKEKNVVFEGMWDGLYYLYTCNFCSKAFMRPFLERRYRCAVCSEFDLCEACYVKGKRLAHTHTQCLACGRNSTNTNTRGEDAGGGADSDDDDEHTKETKAKAEAKEAQVETEGEEPVGECECSDVIKSHKKSHEMHLFFRTSKRDMFITITDKVEQEGTEEV